jgi:hypothetical protein
MANQEIIRITDLDSSGKAVGEPSEYPPDRVPKERECTNNSCKRSRKDKRRHRHPTRDLVDMIRGNGQSERRVPCEGGEIWPPRSAKVAGPTKRCLCGLKIDIIQNEEE